MLLTADKWFEKIDDWSVRKKTFFGFINYDLSQGILHQTSALPPEIKFDFSNQANSSNSQTQLTFNHYSKNDYQFQFENIIKHINLGDTYLLNLTVEIPLKNTLDLEKIFQQTHAKYKILWKDNFVCFSPESFIKIDGNQISTTPMKGTDLVHSDQKPNAILKNPKEIAEQYTITDLLRNDLSKVANDVRVEKFRYVDEIKVSENQKILQTSTKIVGNLSKPYENKYGSILKELLPAGSISGAPKLKTTQIIRDIEIHNRGFYTGIGVYFDGKTFDSCIMIRFIEQRENKFYFKTGGGITHASDLVSEYNELHNKVRLPIY